MLDNTKEKNLQCPYCDSMNTVYIDTQEEADPDDNGAGGEGTIYHVFKNYKCKNCGCKFHWYKEVQTYYGIDIDEDGEDDFEISVIGPYDSEFIGYIDDDVEEYMNFDEDKDYIYDEETGQYHLPKEKQWIEDAYGIEDCPTIKKEKKELEGYNVDIDVNASSYDQEFVVTLKSTNLDDIRNLIADGESTGNTLHHLIYYALDDHKDELADIESIEISPMNSDRISYKSRYKKRPRW